MKHKQASNGVQIDKNVPMPPKRGSGWTDAIRKMEVGDSILWLTTSNYTALAKQAGLKIKLSARRDNGQLRVWRVE